MHMGEKGLSSKNELKGEVKGWEKMRENWRKREVARV